MLRFEHLFPLRAEVDLVRQIVRLLLHLADALLYLADVLQHALLLVPLVADLLPVLLSCLPDVRRPLLVLGQGRFDCHVLDLDEVD